VQSTTARALAHPDEPDQTFAAPVHCCLIVVVFNANQAAASEGKGTKALGFRV
jgi:hypothetical protein